MAREDPRLNRVFTSLKDWDPDGLTCRIASTDGCTMSSLPIGMYNAQRNAETVASASIGDSAIGARSVGMRASE